MAKEPWQLLGDANPVTEEMLLAHVSAPPDSKRVHSTMAVATLPTSGLATQKLDLEQTAASVASLMSHVMSQFGMPAEIYKGKSLCDADVLAYKNKAGLSPSEFKKQLLADPVASVSTEIVKSMVVSDKVDHAEFKSTAQAEPAFDKQLSPSKGWPTPLAVDYVIPQPDILSTTASVESSHMMFESTAREKALALEPRLCCPNCGQPVSGFINAVQQYKTPPAVTSTADCPFPELLQRMSYTLEPCSCRVTPEWAAEFTNELNRRMAGETPLPICDLTTTQRHQQVKKIEAQISDLYSRLDKAATTEAKARIQYYLVLAVDYLMRLTPGAHNCVKPVALDPEVRLWANKHSYQLPPDKSVDKTPAAKDFGSVAFVGTPKSHVSAIEQMWQAAAAAVDSADDYEYPATYKMPKLYSKKGVDPAATFLPGQDQEAISRAKVNARAIVNLIDANPEFCKSLCTQYVLGDLPMTADACLAVIRKELQGYQNDKPIFDKRTYLFIDALESFVTASQKLPPSGLTIQLANAAPVKVPPALAIPPVNNPAGTPPARISVVDQLLREQKRQISDIDLD